MAALAGLSVPRAVHCPAAPSPHSARLAPVEAAGCSLQLRAREEGEAKAGSKPEEGRSEREGREVGERECVYFWLGRGRYLQAGAPGADEWGVGGT